MMETVLDLLKGLPKEIITIIIASLPISELRGAIPVALAMGVPPAKAFCLAILGNLIPVIPILFLLEPVSSRLRKFMLWRKFFDWLFERTKRRGDIIQKYEALGLVAFVAIPLPITGAWTGCVAASLFKIKFRYAFLAILLGVIIAGIIVLTVSLFGKGAFVFLIKEIG